MCIRDRYKLVVRLLPPNLTKQQFTDTLASNDVTVEGESFYYVQGHYSSKLYKRQTHSRAYIHLDSLESLQHIAKIIRNCKFIDDLGNSMLPQLQLSPFIKKINDTEVNSLQGSISKDHVFQTFMKSWKLMNEDKTNTLVFKELSVITPLRKELEREHNSQAELKQRKDRALIELAGNPSSKEDRKKNKKKRRKKKQTHSREDEEGETRSTEAEDQKAIKAKKRVKKKLLARSKSEEAAHGKDGPKDNDSEKAKKRRCV